jgi:hypothetical protein
MAKDAQVRTKNRNVVVLCHGWIYAGDCEDRGGRIYMTRVVWVFTWRGIGFSKVLENPLQGGVDIRPNIDASPPMHSEIIRFPVSDDWGIRP